MTKHEAAQAYLREAVNFGPDDSDIRTAEYDAFIAGWEARIARAEETTGSGDPS